MKIEFDIPSGFYPTAWVTKVDGKIVERYPEDWK